MTNEGLLTRDEFIVNVCGDCYMETKWTDEECRICLSNTMTAAKAQLAKLKEEGWVQLSENQSLPHFLDFLPRTECCRIANLLGSTEGKVAMIGDAVIRSILTGEANFKRVK